MVIGNGMTTNPMFALIIGYSHLTSTEFLTQIINPLSTNTMNFTECFLTDPDFGTARRPNVIQVSNISLALTSDPFALDLHFLD